MLIFSEIGGSRPFDPLILLIFAIIFDACIGDMKFLFRVIIHPITLIGSLISFLDEKLNRSKRGEIDRIMRGILCVLFMILISGIFSLGIVWLSFNHPMGWIIELLLITSLIAGRSLFDHVNKVTIKSKISLEEGREAVSHIVSRDVKRLDIFGVARAAIESTAENLSDGVIAPIFWYLLLGFPGLLIYKTINTMDSMIGYKTPKYKAFGMAAAKCDDLANLIPARLTALFILLASIFVPTTNPKKSLQIILRDSNKHQSPNAGWPEAAMAGALNISLAGPKKHQGQIKKAPWIGNGTAKVLIRDIDRALYVYIVANLINLGWISAIIIIKLSLT